MEWIKNEPPKVISSSLENLAKLSVVVSSIFTGIALTIARPTRVPDKSIVLFSPIYLSDVLLTILEVLNCFSNGS